MWTMKLSFVKTMSYIGCLLLGTGTLSWAVQKKPTIAFDQAIEGTIFFKAPPGEKAPKPMKTSLFDVVYLGELHSKASDVPYFVVTAKGCRDCSDDRTIYVIRPTGGTYPFVYPGKTLDPKTHAPLLVSEAFYGKCLLNHGDVLVIYQKERVDRRKGLQGSVLIAEPGDDFLDEKLIERHLPNINQTYRLVKKGICKSIPGRNRYMSKTTTFPTQAP